MEFFGSCHNHTDRSNFRLRDSTNRLDELCWYAAEELQHNFIAITDHETIATAIDCQQVEKEIREKYPNFKIIRGNEIYLCRNGLSKDNYKRGEDKFYHFILLAKDFEGHQQIRELSTRAWSHCFISGRMMRVPTYYSDLQEVIGQNPGHVIFSSACIGSKPAQLVLDYYKNPTIEKYEYIKAWVEHIADICGRENFFLETQPSFNKEQIIVNQTYKKLSEELGFPVVISLDAHYLKKEHEQIHHAFLTAQNGERETADFYATTYMMSREEIHSYMDSSLGKETVSLWMNNTKKIYEVCKDYDLTKPTRIVYLPLTVDTITNEDFLRYKNKILELEYFYTSPHKENRDLAAAIVKAILNRKEDFDNIETFSAIDDNLKAVRLASEKMNTQWSAYLLNLRDYVKVIWEKGNSLMGCARGSSTGFFLLYLLNVTQINPLWETTKTYSFRFLNPERVSPLDVDLDIEGGKRPQVYKALQETYGADRVSKVLTVRTEKSKSALLTACYLPNTLIYTNQGLKEIQKIERGTEVFTTNGIEKVIIPTYREYNGDIYSFAFSGIGLPLQVTNNHKFLVYTHGRVREAHGQTRNYKKCNLYDPNGNLIKRCLSIEEASRYYQQELGGSYSSMNRNKKHNGYYILKEQESFIENDVIKWLTAEDIEKTDFLLSPVYENELKDDIIISFSKEEQNPNKKNVNYIRENIEVNEDLGELLGIYLAEGNINSSLHGITFTISQEEIALKEKIISLLKKVFNLSLGSISCYNKSDTKGLSIQVNSTPLGRWFNKYCYGTAINKTVPCFIMKSSPSVQLALLKGCFLGDGYARKRNNGSYEGKITSISYKLIFDLWQIAAINKVNCSCITEDRRTSGKNISYNLMFYGDNAELLYQYKYNQNNFENFTKTDDYIFYNDKKYYPIKINSITKKSYNGFVYCFETPSHNYVINNIISHNCRGLGLEPDEAQYLASFIKSDRGQQRTLQQTYYGDIENDIKPDLKFKELMDGKYNEVWKVANFISGLCCGVGN